MDPKGRDSDIPGILVAGIGATLGTEIARSLRAAGGYRVLGCDSSALSFGHYSTAFDKTFLASRETFVEDTLAICRSEAASVVIPGGEQPMRLFARSQERFERAGVKLGMNSAHIVERLGDKASCFIDLQRLGFDVPQTVELPDNSLLKDFPEPCIIKPSAESGGSSFVFFARDREEAGLYAEYLRRNGKRPIAQEYTPHHGGEFTVGVLSAPSGEVLGAIALERAFEGISVMVSSPDFLISSGVSQGRIAEFKEICETVSRIALAVGSVGPLNVQGRVDKKGRFLPFEINPRFSASTHLRTLAGFNEVDVFVSRLLGKPAAAPLSIRPGWYLRSFDEVFVPEANVKS